MWSDWNAVYSYLLLPLVTIGHAHTRHTLALHQNIDTTQKRQQKQNEQNRKEKKKKTKDVLNSFRKTLMLTQFRFGAFRSAIFCWFDKIYKIFFCYFCRLMRYKYTTTTTTAKNITMEMNEKIFGVWKTFEKKIEQLATFGYISVLIDSPIDRQTSGECRKRAERACRRRKSHRNTTKFTTIYFCFI